MLWCVGVYVRCPRGGKGGSGSRDKGRDFLEKRLDKGSLRGVLVATVRFYFLDFTIFILGKNAIKYSNRYYR